MDILTYCGAIKDFNGLTTREVPKSAQFGMKP